MKLYDHIYSESLFLSIAMQSLVVLSFCMNEQMPQRLQTLYHSIGLKIQTGVCLPLRPPCTPP